MTHEDPKKERSPSPPKQDTMIERIQIERETIMSKTYHTLRESKDLHNFLKTQTKKTVERKSITPRDKSVHEEKVIEEFLQFEQEAASQKRP